MIKSGINISLRPEEIRAMVPQDAWLCFAGWNEAHAEPSAGSEAMTSLEYKQLVERVDGS